MQALQPKRFVSPHMSQAIMMWPLLFLAILADLTPGRADVVTQPVQGFWGHSHRVNSVAFSPDGTQLLTGSDDDTAKLWNSTTGTLILTLYGHGGDVNSAEFSPSGDQILTGSDDDTARLWNAKTGALIQTFRGHTNDVSSVAFSPNGSEILTGGSWEGIAKIWNQESGLFVRMLSGHRGYLYCLAFSPDGVTILTGGQDDTAKIWDSQTGALLLTLDGHQDDVTNLAFSPNGAYLATGSQDRTAKIWDVHTGALIQTLSGHAFGVNATAFSPDGTQLVTGSSDHTANLWDVKSARPIHTFLAHGDEVRATAFAPDGLHCATGSADHTAMIWSTAAFSDRTIAANDTIREASPPAAQGERLNPSTTISFTAADLPQTDYPTAYEASSNRIERSSFLDSMESSQREKETTFRIKPGTLRIKTISEDEGGIIEMATFSIQNKSQYTIRYCQIDAQFKGGFDKVGKDWTNFTDLAPNDVVIKSIFLHNHTLKGNIKWTLSLDRLTIIGPDGKTYDAAEYYKLEVR